MPHGTLGLDLKLVQETIQNSMAPHTWVNYAAAWKKWAAFLAGQDFFSCVSDRAGPFVFFYIFNGIQLFLWSYG